MRGVALRKLISRRIRMISDKRCSSHRRTGSLRWCLQVRQRGESGSLLTVCFSVSVKGIGIVCICLFVYAMVCKDEEQRWKRRSGPCSVISFLGFLLLSELPAQKRLSYG